jgi:hypothetical protein
MKYTEEVIQRLINDINSRPLESFAFSETKVHGARYYAVEPIGGNWLEMSEWALATYGESGSLWDTECHRWYMNDRKFIFRNEADRTMFILRWQC